MGWTAGGRGFFVEAAPRRFIRGETYRRFSTESRLGVVEACLAGEGGLKGLATKAGVGYSLVHYWLKQYHAGELSLDLLRVEESVETAQHIAALERKVEVRSSWSSTC